MTLSAEDRVVMEKTTPIYTCYLYDAAGAAVPSANIVSIVMTLWAAKTGTVINSRDGQSVFNANQGTYHATSGLFTMAWVVGDTTIIDTTLAAGELEEHKFQLTWTYETSKVGKHEDSFLVKQLLKTT